MEKIYIFDEIKAAETLAFALGMHGYEAIASDNACQAFRQIITFQPKLVLAEYLDVDGEWLCRQLRQVSVTRDLPIIMMSHKGSQVSNKSFEAMILGFGANAYLPKPFPYREIGNFVNSWLQAS